ncbi:hypothetical protein K3495_g4147 [Podosphaera aphanis]|nr:hypothetical protein K3495_g4147 [Podosphaera aphanis]
MKVLTLNFLQCAVKACKSSSDAFPLHLKDCELVSDPVALNPLLLRNVLPRIDWTALQVTARELALPLPLPPNLPTPAELDDDPQLLQNLHRFLLETQISEGALRCANCGHEYQIREGIANFLLPNHLV